MQLYEAPETPKEIKKIESRVQLSAIVVLLLAVLLSATFTYINRIRVINLENEVNTLKSDNIALNKKVETLELPKVEQIPDETPFMAYSPVEFTGTISKEEIPEEYALGDYWYILYFDEAQTIETVAGDEELDSIHLDVTSVKVDDYLEQGVQVIGRLSTGFAETPIVLVDEIKVL